MARFRSATPSATMRRLLAASPADRPTGEALAMFGTLIASFAAKDRRMVDLFLVLLVRHPSSTRIPFCRCLANLPARPMAPLRRIPWKPFTTAPSATFRRRPKRHLPAIAAPSTSMACSTRSNRRRGIWQLLKQSADSRLPHNSARLRRLENDLKNVLVKRFLGEVEAQTRSHTQALHGLVRNDASPADRKAFNMAMQASVAQPHPVPGRRSGRRLEVPGRGGPAPPFPASWIRWLGMPPRPERRASGRPWKAWSRRCTRWNRSAPAVR